MFTALFPSIKTAEFDWNIPIIYARDAIDCKERHFVQGNHEVWLDKFVIRYPYLEQYKTENALKIKERGYEYHPYNRKKLLKLYT